MKKTFKIFLIVLLGILVLLTGTILFTQTSLFKSWLKDTIVTQINQAIQGQVSIKSLSGNLFTHLSIFDIELISQQDTLISINQIELNFVPLKFLKNEIFIEKLVLKNAEIHLNQESDSSWNITRIFSSDDDLNEPSKKTDSHFPYLIRLLNCQIDSSRLLIQALSNSSSQRVDIRKIEFSGHYGPQTKSLEMLKCELNSVSPDLAIENLTFDFLQEHQQYTLKNFNLKTTRNELKLAAESTDLPPTQASLTAETAPLHWNEFEFLLPDITFKIWPQVSIKANYQADSLNLILNMNDSSQTAAVELKLGHVTSFFDDRMDSLRYSSRLLLDNFEVASLYPDFPIDMHLTGVINLSGKGFSKENALIDISGDLSRSVIANRPVSTLIFEGGYRRGNANLDADIVGESGEFHLRARAQNLLETPSYSINGMVSGFNYASLFPADSIVTHINARFQAEGGGLTVKDLNAVYQFSVYPSMINEIAIDTVFSRGHIEGSSIILDTLLLSGSQVMAQGSGLLDLKGNNNVSYQLQIQDLMQFREWFKLDTLQGSGQLTGHFQGTFDSLATQLSFVFEDINVNGNLVSAVKGESEISMQDGGYWGGNTLSLLQLDLAGQDIDSVRIETSFIENKIDLELEVMVQENYSGGLKSTIFVDSIVSIILPQVFLNLEELAWQGGGPTTEIIYDDGKIQIVDFTLSNRNDPTQRIEMDGTFDLEGSQDLSLNVANVDINTLSPHLPISMTVGGRLNFHLDIGGIAELPVIEGNLEINGIQLGEYQYQNLTGSLDYRDSMVVIRADLNTNQPSIMWLEGRLPVHIAFKTFKFEIFPDKPLAFHFASDSLKLSMLTLDPGKTQNIQGTLLGDFSIGNTLNHPSLEGFIKLTDASIKIPKYGVLYDHIELDMHATDSTVYLDNLKILRSKGLIKADGYIRFSDNIIYGQIFSSLLQFDINDFYVIKHKDFEILIAGDARVSGVPDSAKLSGGITIKRSSFYVPALLALTGKRVVEETGQIPLLIQATSARRQSERTKEANFQEDTLITNFENGSLKILKRLTGNITLSIPRNTWIKGVNWRIELDGNLDLIKQNKDFELFGRIGIVRGNYDLLGRRFNIRQGRLDFKGGKDINPEISMEAELELRTRDRAKKLMRLFVSGEVKRPVFRFTLDGREISQADAVSYVVTGRSMDELSYGEQAGLDESSIATDLTSGLLTRQLNQQLGQELNLDYLEIKGKDNWQSATFVVGKYITNELFMSYQREFGDSNDDDIAPETVTVEYEITRNIYLQVIEGDSKARGFDLIFKLDK